MNNLDALLNPLSDTSPCGIDLFGSMEFDEIDELRREDDPTLPPDATGEAPKVADWSQVKRRCEKLLAEKGKHLRLCLWWTEAAAMTQGFVGLRQGLELCSQVCDKYWSQLHPVPDETGDVSERIGNMVWLLTKRMPSLVRSLPVTQSGSGSFTLIEWQSARALQPSLEKNPEKAAQLPPHAVTMEKFNRALRETSKSFLRTSVDELTACLKALQDWDAVIQTHIGTAGPSFGAAREAIDWALQEVRRLAREMGAVEVAAPAPETQPTAQGAEAGSTVQQAASVEPMSNGPRGGPPRTREQALEQLREVATYFRSTEPHSPVAYLVEKALNWAEMPLHLWLRAVVKDNGALAHLEDVLGVDPKNGSSN